MSKQGIPVEGPQDRKLRHLAAAGLAVAEANRAVSLFPVPFHSRHEGYAVLLEEVEELWDAIRANDYAAAHKEAVQVAAMALRFVAECPPEEPAR